MTTADACQRDYDSAMEAWEDGDIDEARECLQRMLKTFPSDHRTMELSGDFARLREEFKKADQLYKKMLSDSDDLLVVGKSSFC